MIDTAPFGEDLLATPHDPDAENALAALAMIEADRAIPVARSIGLTSDDIFLPAAAMVWEAACSLYDRSQGVDPTSIASWLRTERPVFMEGQGMKELSHLFSVASSGRANPEHVLDYAKSIQGRAVLRRMARMFRDYQLRLPRINDVSGFLAEINYDLLTLGSKTQDVEVKGFDDLMLETFPFFQERVNNPELVTGLRTPVDRVNEMTTGMQPKEYWVFSALPGYGKTSWGTDTALLNAIKYDAEVHFISCEMDGFAMAEKIISTQFKIPVQGLRTGSIGQKYQSACEAYSEMISEKLSQGYKNRFSNVRFMEAAGKTAPEIEAMIKTEAARRGKKPRLVVIDYIQNVAGHAGDGRREQIEETSEYFRVMTLRMGCSTLALSQLNKDGGTFGSAGPEQDAHVHIKMGQDEQKDFWLRIDKNRKGPKGDFKVGFNGEFGLFHDLR